MTEKIKLSKEEMLILLLDGASYQQIAKSANVSRQRVQQILAPPIAIRDFVSNKYHNRCNDCGIYVGKSGHIHHENKVLLDNYNDILNLVLLCISCHRKRHGGQDSKYNPNCPRCGGPMFKSGLSALNKEGYKKQRFVCSICGRKMQ